MVASALLSKQSVPLSSADGNFQTLQELSQCMRASMLLPGIAGPLVRISENRTGSSLERTFWPEPVVVRLFLLYLPPSLPPRGSSVHASIHSGIEEKHGSHSPPPFPPSLLPLQRGSQRDLTKGSEPLCDPCCSSRFLIVLS